MAEEAKEAHAEPAAGGGSKLVMIVTLVNMLVCVGIMAVLFLSLQKEKPAQVTDIAAGGHGGGHGEAAGGHGEKKEGGHGGGHGEAGGGEAETVVDVGKIIPLEIFTVNLTTAVGTQPRYVRMNVSVELEQNVPDKEFELKLPRIRDTIINLLNSKKASEISALEGRMQLKEDIKRTLNSFMLQSKIKDVYFTNFAIN